MAKKYFSYYLILTGNQKNEDEMITCFHSSVSLNENRRSLCTPLAHVFYLLGTQLCHMTMGLGCAQHPEVQRSILKDCHLQPEASAVLWRGHPTALPGWRLLRGAVCGGRPKVQHFFFSLSLSGREFSTMSQIPGPLQISLMWQTPDFLLGYFPPSGERMSSQDVWSIYTSCLLGLMNMIPSV